MARMALQDASGHIISHENGKILDPIKDTDLIFVISLKNGENQLVQHADVLYEETSPGSLVPI